LEEEVKNNKKKFNKKALIAVVVCAAILIGAVAYDLIRNNSEYEDTTVAMGTIIKIKIIGPNGESASSVVEDEINNTENALLSWRVDGSDIYRINAGAGSAVSVSQETADIISKSLEVSSNCGGALDITLGKITQLWDFGGDNQRVPSESEIYSYLPYVGYKNVTVSGSSVTIGKNQSLDLGAVGKGAACDRVSNALNKTKVKSAVISVGGSLLLYGNKEFTIGIVNPTDDTTYMGTLKLSDTCISTSGNYEKTFVENGVTYHHILDPKTGYPTSNDLSGVTVICKSGIVSDALSTACYILGYDNSLALLKKYDAQAVFIYSDKSVKYTDGLKDVFSITDNSFKVSE
jgi:thiamine biosynthesis lipoprotein